MVSLAMQFAEDSCLCRYGGNADTNEDRILSWRGSGDYSRMQMIERNREIYGIAHWGAGYFDIDARGRVCVQPAAAARQCIDLREIIDALRVRNIGFPVLLRFTDILADRIHALQRGFASACREHRYAGSYIPVYPIKVNQQRSVIEAILAAGDVGLEAGSKPELLAIMGFSEHGMVICNGYKDRAYIRLALIGLQMGLNLYLVIEKPSELELVIAEAMNLGVRPRLGIRIRLASISDGKWQNSGGEKSKFGFHASEITSMIERLENAGLLNTLQLMHFHMGSQVANIHAIKTALREAGQFYAALHQLGAAIKTVDVGGGLAVDYDGSQSRNEFSCNYSIDEYARNVVRCFAEICAKQQLPQPDIITESGRAITAHHAVLITDVIAVERLAEEPVGQSGSMVFHQHSREYIDSNPLESWHDAQFDINEARTLFAQGRLQLDELAAAERQYLAVCQRIEQSLDPGNHAQREVLHELREKLADKVFCNFSLFQSMPDVWGIAQVFPIMPLQRLDELPSRRAVIQDLTCDSDGRMDHYIDAQNIEKTMRLHDIGGGENYLLGFFLLGAYQEILGDMHNLFGETHAVDIALEHDSYRIIEATQAATVSDLLAHVHIDADTLQRRYREKLAGAALTNRQRQLFEQELMQALAGNTYLEK